MHPSVQYALCSIYIQHSAKCTMYNVHCTICMHGFYLYGIISIVAHVCIVQSSSVFVIRLCDRRHLADYRQWVGLALYTANTGEHFGVYFIYMYIFIHNIYFNILQYTVEIQQNVADFHCRYYHCCIYKMNSIVLELLYVKRQYNTVRMKLNNCNF